ncbi:MAG: hypothetical protein NT086_12880 [Proteobacteria bacterium]|nr:hypothetical protein [Pseudomonadota bacterium]
MSDDQTGEKNIGAIFGSIIGPVLAISFFYIAFLIFEGAIS